MPVTILRMKMKAIVASGQSFLIKQTTCIKFNVNSKTVEKKTTNKQNKQTKG